MLSRNLSMILVAPQWPQKEWFSDLLALMVEVPLELSMLGNLLMQPHIGKFHKVGVTASSCLETIKLLVCLSIFLLQKGWMGPTNLRKAVIPSRNKSSMSEFRRSLIWPMCSFSTLDSRGASTIKPRIKRRELAKKMEYMPSFPKL